MTDKALLADRPEISLICGNLGPDKISLFISGTEGARNIRKLNALGITAVINCAVNLDINYAENVNYEASNGKAAAGVAPLRTYKVGLIDGTGNPVDMLLGAYFILESALDQKMPTRDCDFPPPNFRLH